MRFLRRIALILLITVSVIALIIGGVYWTGLLSEIAHGLEKLLAG